MEKLVEIKNLSISGTVKAEQMELLLKLLISAEESNSLVPIFDILLEKINDIINVLEKIEIATFDKV